MTTQTGIRISLTDGISKPAKTVAIKQGLPSKPISKSLILLPDTLDNRQYYNLIRLVQNKAELLKKSLDTTELTIYRDSGKIHFDWETGIDTALLRQFLQTLVNFAQKAKRVYYTETAVTNERYSMRVWLLQLGCVGAEYKELRKALLLRLSGNSAFRDR